MAECRPCDVPGCPDPNGGTLDKRGRRARMSLKTFGRPDVIACKTCYEMLYNRFRRRGRIDLDVERGCWRKAAPKTASLSDPDEFDDEPLQSNAVILKLVGDFRESERKRIALRDHGLKILNRKVSLDDFTNFGHLFSVLLVRAVRKKNHRLILGRHEFTDKAQQLGNKKHFA